MEANGIWIPAELWVLILPSNWEELKLLRLVCHDLRALIDVHLLRDNFFSFPDNTLKRLIKEKEECVAVWQWLHQQLHWTLDNIFFDIENVFEQCTLAVCTWMFDTFREELQTQHRKMFEAILSSNSVEKCDWIHSILPDTVSYFRTMEHMLHLIVKPEHTNVWLWLHKTFDIRTIKRENMISVLGVAVCHGALEFCIWLHSVIQFTRDEIRGNRNVILHWAAAREYGDLCVWLYYTFSLTAQDLEKVQQLHRACGFTTFTFLCTTLLSQPGLSMLVQ